MSVSGTESGMIGNIATAAVAHLLVALVLFRWGRWVARRHESATWRRAAWMPIVAVLLLIVGVVVSTLMLIGSFGAVAHADEANKAQVLAQHISEAMNVTAVFLLPSALIYAASLVAFTVGSLLRPHRTSVMEHESSEHAPYSRPALIAFVTALAGLAIDIVGGACSSVLVFPIVIGIAFGIGALVWARRARIDINNHAELAGRKLALAATVIGILLLMPVNVLFLALLDKGCERSHNLPHEL